MQNVDTIGIITIILYFGIKEWLARRREQRYHDDRHKWKNIIEHQSDSISSLKYEIQLMHDKLTQLDIKDITQRLNWFYDSNYKTLDRSIERMADAIEGQNKILRRMDYDGPRRKKTKLPKE